jgi:hypothetical protein
MLTTQPLNGIIKLQVIDDYTLTSYNKGMITPYKYKLSPKKRKPINLMSGLICWVCSTTKRRELFQI